MQLVFPIPGPLQRFPRREIRTIFDGTGNLSRHLAVRESQGLA